MAKTQIPICERCGQEYHAGGYGLMVHTCFMTDEAFHRRLVLERLDRIGELLKEILEFLRTN